VIAATMLVGATLQGTVDGATSEKPAPQCAALGGARASACEAATTEPADGPGGSDEGLHVAYCPAIDRSGLRLRRAIAANTSEVGWPPDQCLKMDKGSWPAHHTIVGERGVHNWLLGGYGNDTIIGGNAGDVIWGDYQPSGGPPVETATIYAGNGRNVIYADDTHDFVWTGTNPKTVVHAHNAGDSGAIHCQSAGVVVYLSTVSERDFKLYGCHHISHYSVGY
jgi:RTX calcium-binding nonapeptide repeat (4 copies)